eukprot:4444977-Prymnesium_polylepis.1
MGGLYEAFGRFDSWLKQRSNWVPSPISPFISRGGTGQSARGPPLHLQSIHEPLSSYYGPPLAG